LSIRRQGFGFNLKACRFSGKDFDPIQKPVDSPARISIQSKSLSIRRQGFRSDQKPRRRIFEASDSKNGSPENFPGRMIRSEGPKFPRQAVRRNRTARRNPAGATNPIERREPAAMQKNIVYLAAVEYFWPVLPRPAEQTQNGGVPAGLIKCNIHFFNCLVLYGTLTARAPAICAGFFMQPGAGASFDPILRADFLFWEEAIVYVGAIIYF
jgi:hypothetical protein